MTPGQRFTTEELNIRVVVVRVIRSSKILNIVTKFIDFSDLNRSFVLNNSILSNSFFQKIVNVEKLEQ